MLLPSFVLATVFTGVAATEYLAAYFSAKPGLASLQRAVRLQPGSADYRYRVGRYATRAEAERVADVLDRERRRMYVIERISTRGAQA